MKGLRTQEGNKFEKYFEIVQNTAQKHNRVFFLDAGEGNDIITDDFEGENLTGWLIPKEKATHFEKKFMSFNNGDEWDDFFAFASWYKEKEQVKILFRIYDNNGKLLRELK